MNGFGSPFGGVPGGDVKVENPDGIIHTEGDRTVSNLYDRGGTRPMIPSGDWQVRQVRIEPGSDPTK